MMTRAISFLLVFAVSQVIAQEAPDPGKESLVDEGVFVVSGRPGTARAEEFSIYKRPDGGYTLLNSITADDDSYVASGTWNFDAQWRAISANGQSDVNGLKRKIEVKRENSPEGPIVRIKRQTVPKDGDNIRIEEFTALCDMDCLIDMAPAALPMAVMPRRYDMAKGGEQMFKWVGVSFTDDRILTDGGAALWLNRMQEAGGQQISHWRFREDLPGANGQRMEMNMHLWTDAKVTLRKFGVGRTEKPTTIGIRETDERLSAQMSPE
jgi:hypothetical protein